MNRSLRRVALAVALVVASGSAAAASPSNMNYDYEVRGDAQALPVQAFDDGEALYVQLRNTANPPAPVGANGPLPYTLRGPYMVLPRVSQVTLRIGAYTATVMAEGAGDVLPGVVSVRRPVEVTDALINAPETSAVPRPASAPEASRIATEVVGEIVVNGKAGGRPAAVAPMVAGAKSLSFAEAAQASAYAGMGRVTVKADGTSAGAEAALTAMQACKASGVVCSIEYRGAESNRIMVVEAGK